MDTHDEEVLNGPPIVFGRLGTCSMFRFSGFLLLFIGALSCVGRLAKQFGYFFGLSFILAATNYTYLTSDSFENDKNNW